MRVAVWLLTGVVVLAGDRALALQQPTATRYGLEPDYVNYPQKSPKEALASVLRAIDQRRIDYLLAQLTDPAFVDQRVKALNGGFAELVRETTAKLGDDPLAVKELRRFLREGEWDEGGDAATVKLKDVKGRAVFLRKVNERWFFENRQKPSPEAAK